MFSLSCGTQHFRIHQVSRFREYFPSIYQKLCCTNRVVFLRPPQLRAEIPSEYLRKFYANINDAIV
jgi:hypothetical protein